MIAGLRKAVHDLADNAAGLSGKVYFDEIPPDVTGLHAVYFSVDGLIEEKDTADRIKAEYIQFSIFCKNKSQVDAAAESLEDQFNNASISITGKNTIYCQVENSTGPKKEGGFWQHDITVKIKLY